ASRHTGATNNIGAGGSTTVAPGTFFAQVTPQQADVSAPWAQSLELYITPWGFLKGAEANNATAKKDGKFTVLSWSPAVKAPSGKAYTVNAYVNGQNQIERVETWLGENIMGDMHIVATYSGWKDFGGVMAPASIVQTRGEWPFFEVTVTSAKGNPADVASLVPAPPARGSGRGPGGGGPAAPAALPCTRRWRPARSSRDDGHHREAGRWNLPPHDRRRQLRFRRRRIQDLRDDAGSRAVPRARGGVRCGDEEAVPEQADPLRDEHAPS